MEKYEGADRDDMTLFLCSRLIPGRHDRADDHENASCCRLYGLNSVSHPMQLQRTTKSYYTWYIAKACTGVTATSCVIAHEKSQVAPLYTLL
jgi:hypothetical protein